jgi:hypothetical protein
LERVRRINNVHSLFKVASMANAKKRGKIRLIINRS